MFSSQSSTLNKGENILVIMICLGGVLILLNEGTVNLKPY